MRQLRERSKWRNINWRFVRTPDVNAIHEVRAKAQFRIENVRRGSGAVRLFLEKREGNARCLQSERLEVCFRGHFLGYIENWHRQNRPQELCQKVQIDRNGLLILNGPAAIGLSLY